MKRLMKRLSAALIALSLIMPSLSGCMGEISADEVNSLLATSGILTSAQGRLAHDLDWVYEMYSAHLLSGTMADSLQKDIVNANNSIAVNGMRLVQRNYSAGAVSNIEVVDVTPAPTSEIQTSSGDVVLKDSKLKDGVNHLLAAISYRAVPFFEYTLADAEAGRYGGMSSTVGCPSGKHGQHVTSVYSEPSLANYAWVALTTALGAKANEGNDLALFISEKTSKQYAYPSSRAADIGTAIAPFSILGGSNNYDGDKYINEIRQNMSVEVYSINGSIGSSQLQEAMKFLADAKSSGKSEYITAGKNFFVPVEMEGADVSERTGAKNVINPPKNFMEDTWSIFKMTNGKAEKENDKYVWKPSEGDSWDGIRRIDTVGGESYGGAVTNGKSLTPNFKSADSKEPQASLNKPGFPKGADIGEESGQTVSAMGSVSAIYGWHAETIVVDTKTGKTELKCVPDTTSTNITSTLIELFDLNPDAMKEALDYMRQLLAKFEGGVFLPPYTDGAGVFHKAVIVVCEYPLAVLSGFSQVPDSIMTAEGASASSAKYVPLLYYGEEYTLTTESPSDELLKKQESMKQSSIRTLEVNEKSDSAVLS